jgi:pyruvate/2-oxoglutarate dehydrogenase complex dihydrolipoamide dehydrogenase (E3) component
MWNLFHSILHIEHVPKQAVIFRACPDDRLRRVQVTLSAAKISKEFGITCDGFAIDMSGVRDRKRKMVVGLNEMYMENYRKTGAEFILGTGGS